MSKLNRPQFTTKNNLFGVSITGGRENTVFQVFVHDDGVWNAQTDASTGHLDDLIECLQKAKNLLETHGKKHKWRYRLATNLTRESVQQLFEGDNDEAL